MGIQACSNHDPGDMNGFTPRGQRLTYDFKHLMNCGDSYDISWTWLFNLFES